MKPYPGGQGVSSLAIPDAHRRSIRCEVKEGININITKISFRHVVRGEIPGYPIVTPAVPEGVALYHGSPEPGRNSFHIWVEGESHHRERVGEAYSVYLRVSHIQYLHVSLEPLLGVNSVGYELNCTLDHPRIQCYIDVLVTEG